MHRLPSRSAVLLAALSLAVTAGESLAEQEVGNPDAGKFVFQQCAGCHSIGSGAGSTNAGPSLNGVFERRSGADTNFNYSPQMRSARLVWDAPTLSRFLTAPRRAVPGTRMLFNGLATPAEVADVIAYIARFDETGAVKR
jgi:cytochrome c2